jgi:hypothetical protein
MAIPNEFFTAQTMLTLSGATGATFVVCNGLQKAFDFNPKWLALVVAQAIVLTGVYAVGGTQIVDYCIGLVNGFLVYCAATGATAVAGPHKPDDMTERGGTAQASDLPHTSQPPPRGFLTPWF